MANITTSNLNSIINNETMDLAEQSDEGLQQRSINENKPLLNNLDETIFTITFFFYLMYRMLKSENFKIGKLLRGKLRAYSIFMLSCSTILNLTHTVMILYLSKKMGTINNIQDSSGFIAGKETVTLYGRIFDPILFTNLIFSCAQIFKISSLFLIIGLWLPSLCIKNLAKRKYEGQNSSNENKKYMRTSEEVVKAISNASIITFSKIYAFFRLPLAILIDLNYIYKTMPEMAFYRSLFCGTELLLIAMFIILLETKLLSTFFRKDEDTSKTITSVLENINILVLLLIIQAITKFYINILALPLSLNSNSIIVLRKISFVADFSIIIQMVNLLCPNFIHIFHEDKETELKKDMKTNKKISNELFNESTDKNFDLKVITEKVVHEISPYEEYTNHEKMSNR